ncbi:MAG TPA: universal stress protein [Stellaceae bacterium]|nr:universal stress protein [Stellaceae bacterium]
MLKQILVLLGETRSSACARQYAFRLAQSTQSRIAGLAGVDLTYLDSPMIGGIGTSAWQAGINEHIKTQADAACRRLHEIYEAECRDRRLDFEWLSFDGDPTESLYHASESCDLVVTGHDTAFHGDVNKPLSETLTNLLARTPRPAIVCPDDLTPSDAMMLAYDASLPSMRAVQMFTLLGIGEGKSIHVASIDTSQELAARRAAGAVGYLRRHGFEALPHPIVSPLPPAKILAREVADRKIGTLVMGAYGHRGFREFLLGSTTSTLAETPPCALFLYH